MAVGVAVAVLLWWPRGELDGFRTLSGDAALVAGEVRCRSRGCLLEARGLWTSLELGQSAAVRRAAEGVEVLDGVVTFEVDRRASGRRVKVIVSHGTIEVLGTRFTVRQRRGGGGAVVLHRGQIRLVLRGGRTVPLEPGGRAAWPRPTTSAPAAVQPARSATRPVPDAASPSKDAPAVSRRVPGPLTRRGVRDLLEEVERLRSQGGYRQAVRLLRRQLPRVRNRTTRERLSYELGALLTHRLKRRRAACRHWRRHLRRYGGRRYGAEIRREQRRLGCR